MASGEDDPYRTLGLSPGASDDEVRAAYRRLVQIHHPDHNGGSAESARRFEAVQDAYARIRELGRSSPRSARPRRAAEARQAAQSPPDPAVESRIADLERELRLAQEARERARRAAREAASAMGKDPAGAADRPSDEELGYVSTDDSFTKILADARSELADRLADVREGEPDGIDPRQGNPVTRRVGDLIEGLDALADKLRDRPPR